jgi:hypothetical protein
VERQAWLHPSETFCKAFVGNALFLPSFGLWGPAHTFHQTVLRPSCAPQMLPPPLGAHTGLYLPILWTTESPTKVQPQSGDGVVTTYVTFSFLSLFLSLSLSLFLNVQRQLYLLSLSTLIKLF